MILGGRISKFRLPPGVAPLSASVSGPLPWLCMCNSNGSPLSTYSYTARLDGKEYPIQNFAGKVALKRLDANAIERTMAGEDVGKETATWTLSADRKTLTVVAKGTDSAGVAYVSTQVYERQ